MKQDLREVVVAKESVRLRIADLSFSCPVCGERIVEADEWEEKVYDANRTSLLGTVSCSCFIEDEPVRFDLGVQENKVIKLFRGKYEVSTISHPALVVITDIIWAFSIKLLYVINSLILKKVSHLFGWRYDSFD